MRIRYENIKNLGPCFIAFCQSADGYAFGVGPMFFMKNTEEIWKDIVGYESHYQISSFGRVKSPSNDKGRKEKFLKSGGSRIKGHYVYILLSKNNHQKSYLIHRLVAQSFIPNLNNKPHVNHINGIKDDNRVENLEWATRSENMRHADAIGLRIMSKGPKNPKSVSVSQFTLDGIWIRDWIGIAETARITGFDASSISSCSTGRLKTACGFIWKKKQ
jgi:hypothetical protein